MTAITKDDDFVHQSSLPLIPCYFIPLLQEYGRCETLQPPPPEDNMPADSGWEKDIVPPLHLRLFIPAELLRESDVNMFKIQSFSVWFKWITEWTWCWAQRTVMKISCSVNPHEPISQGELLKWNKQVKTGQTSDDLLSLVDIVYLLFLDFICGAGSREYQVRRG